MLCVQHWARVSKDVRLLLIRDGHLYANCNQLTYLAVARNTEVRLGSDPMELNFCIKCPWRSNQS